MIYIKDVTLNEVDALIIPVFEDKETQIEELQKLRASETFIGKEGELFVSTTIAETVKYTIYVGIGKMIDEKKGLALRDALSEATRKAKALKAKKVGVRLALSPKLCIGGNVKIITEAMYLATYQFDKYKTNDTNESKKPFDEVYIIGVPTSKLEDEQEVLATSLNVVEGVMIARDLVNEPSNIIYPETLANYVMDMGKKCGLEVDVMDEKQIKELGMDAFLAVGMGSEKKPRLIVMRHKGNPEDDYTLGLIGKGLTYDTGGYSLKPTDSMKTMHSDMGGAGAVIGTMYALAKNNVKQNVVAVVAACENAISGDSYKPGDIISSMSGKTIEILNTDAEGRLTLADAMTYMMRKEKVNEVIDLATLTGAVLMALGTSTTAVITNNEDFYNRLLASARKTGEQFWQLPAFKEYAKMNKSEVADLKNLGGKLAGTITAGLFVGEFVENDIPWMHLDIAGTAWHEATNSINAKGATGAPVRTLFHLVNAR
nr:leucyl aminopeptidase [uncultured Cellulosilyticum sp.]